MICCVFWERELTAETQQLGYTIQFPWAAAWLCIRLWFTSALCDHQKSNWVWQLRPGLDTMNSYIFVFLSSLLLSVFPVSFQAGLQWCGNKPVLTTIHLSIPVFLLFFSFFFKPLAAFILLELGPLHPPLVSCFFFLFAKKAAETGKWDSVWFHGKGKDDLVYFQPSFSSSPLIKSNIAMEAPRSVQKQVTSHTTLKMQWIFLLFVSRDKCIHVNILICWWILYLKILNPSGRY